MTGNEGPTRCQRQNITWHCQVKCKVIQLKTILMRENERWLLNKCSSIYMTRPPAHTHTHTPVTFRNFCWKPDKCYVFLPFLLLCFTAVNCGPPPNISNAQQSIATSQEFSGIVQVTCNTGYSLNGATGILTCRVGSTTTTGAWSSFTCAGEVM